MESCWPAFVVTVLATILSSGRQVMSDTSCRDYRINERHTICCDGIVYLRSGFRAACCGSVAYDSQHYLCCGRTIAHRQGRLPRCCGERVYDAYRQRCRDGYPVDRTGVGSTCCRTHTGWKCCRRGENCCGPTSYDRRRDAVDVPGFRPACCRATSTRERAACCEAATEKAWYLPPCCDDPDVRPLCCIRTSGEWECCTPEEGYCCAGDSVPVRPETRRPGLVPASSGWQPPPRRLPDETPFVTAAFGLPEIPTPRPTRPPHRPVAPPRRPRPTAAIPLPRPTAAIPRPRPTAAYPRPRPTAAIPRPRPTAAYPRPRPTAAIPRPTAAFPRPRPTAAIPRPRPTAAIPRPTAAFPRPRPTAAYPRPRPTAAIPHPTTAAPLSVPDCCTGPDKPSCCYTVTRWTTCCLLYKKKRRPQPKPGKQTSRRSCCVGASRPACCYSPYVTDDCCKRNSSAVARPTTSPTPSPTPPTEPLVAPYDPPDDEVAPFEGQMASCCSSSSRQECCAYGKRVTGVTPVCCEEEDLQAAMLPDHLSTRIAESTVQYHDYVDYDDGGRVITVIEEDLSCCALSGRGRDSCCASGYRRNGFLPECCARETDGELDARGDVPGDLSYMYVADEPSPDSFTSCCNVTVERRDHCCRAGFMDAEQTFACCEVDPPEQDGDEKPETFDSLRLSAEFPVNSSSMNLTSCCGLETKRRQECCLGNAVADCCPIRGLGRATKERELTSDDCCAKSDPQEIADCCKTKLDGVDDHPLCCPKPSSSQTRKHRRRHGRRQPLRHPFRRQRHRLRHSIDVCEGQFYDRMTQMCCSGKVKLRRGASPKCCGENVYDAAEFRCCPDDSRVARRC